MSRLRENISVKIDSNMSVGNWTVETYRLDEVTKKFSLPCVVCFSEGYMDETECESISKDDIIKIDKRTNLRKVAADFVTDPYEVDLKSTGMTDLDDTYVDLRCGEILIPTNYSGMVKVFKKQEICNSVLQLQKAFPRYALVLCNIMVQTDDRKQLELQAGTRIEIDRTIPGNQWKQDHLVIVFNEKGRDVAVALPVSREGRFKTLPDDNEYTVVEVIERYGFPVVVTFLDDELTHIYSMDLEEGIANMRHISATLLLKRFQQQDAIIGHYKPLEDSSTQPADSELLARRSLVVLPLDNPYIREIQVHVLQDTDEENYDDIFLVSNKSSQLNEFLDGTLYVDFAKKAGPRRLSVIQEKKKETEITVGSPPQRPPKSPKCYDGPTDIIVQCERACFVKHDIFGSGQNDHTAKTLQISESSETGATYQGEQCLPCYDNIQSNENREQESTDGYLTFKATKPKDKPKLPDPQDDLEAYEEVSPPPLQKVSPTSTLADMNFEKYGAIQSKESKDYKLISLGKKHLKLLKDKVIGGKGNKDMKKQLERSKDYGSPSYVSEKEVPSLVEEEEDENQDWYDYPEPDELTKIRMKLQISPQNKQVPKPNKPIAHISPQNTSPKGSYVKPFTNLTIVELEQRLTKCGMAKFAAVCREKELDGKFFETISDEILKQDPFMLNAFDLVKLNRIKENWVPKY